MCDDVFGAWIWKWLCCDGDMVVRFGDEIRGWLDTSFIMGGWHANNGRAVGLRGGHYISSILFYNYAFHYWAVLLYMFFLLIPATCFGTMESVGSCLTTL